MLCKVNRAVVHCRLTGGHAVEASGDGCGPHWVAASQAAQHRLNRVAFGLLAVNNHLLLQLHGFKLNATSWG